MTVREFIKEATARLETVAGRSADFEAKQIARQVFGKGFDGEVSEQQLKTAQSMVLQREKYEPLQYILGEWEFYGLTYKVGKGVLIPRQDTEKVVETAIELLKDIKKPKVFDLCAGSGCIGITLAKKTDANVVLLEKSNEAFEYLEQNVRLNDVQAELIKGDVLVTPDQSFIGTADIIVSNPPYIKSEVIPTLDVQVQFEPVSALDGGSDGLLFYRFITKYWKKVLKDDGILLFEIGYDQQQEVEEILRLEGFKNIVSLKDYGGNFRVVYGFK